MVRFSNNDLAYIMPATRGATRQLPPRNF